MAGMRENESEPLRRTRPRLRRCGDNIDLAGNQRTSQPVRIDGGGTDGCVYDDGRLLYA